MLVANHDQVADNAVTQAAVQDRRWAAASRQ